MKERQFRITGSRCYEIFTYKGDNWESKAIKYFWPKKFSNKYVEHGLTEEKNALHHYEEVFQVGIENCGLFIPFVHPWLGYSPDGIVLNVNGLPEKLIEVKCPYAGIRMII